MFTHESQFNKVFHISAFVDLSIRRFHGRSQLKTYVKTYARMKDGSIRFYKDGYTDLRGRFDFGSLSSKAGGLVIISRTVVSN